MSINKKEILYPETLKSLRENKDKKEFIASFNIEDIFISFRFISKDIVNISIYKDKLIKDNYIEIYEGNFDKNFEVKLSEDKEKYTISNEYLSIYVHKNPFFYEIKRKSETLLKQAIEDRDIAGNRYTDLFKFNLINGQIVSIKDSFSIENYEGFYGFGEKFTPINKRGYDIEAWNYDAYGVCSDKAYKNIPFFLNTKGYGIFINTTSKISYNLATISFDSYTIDLKDCKFDYYFIYGPSFKNIISKYITLTGKVKDVPPKWSFGLWIARYGHKTRKGVEKVIERLRKDDIPADIIGLCPLWLRNGHYCDFVFDEKKFPNPKEMISSFRKKGIKLHIWIQPTVSIKTSMFKEGKEKGYFLKDKKGNVYLWKSPLTNEPKRSDDLINIVKENIEELGLQPDAGMVDFTNPSAVSWYLSKLKYLIDWGIGVIMCDFGEEIPEDAYFYNGKTGKDMRNIYSYLYSGCIYKFIKETRSEKPICLIRSGWAGMHKYPICWSGDPKVTFDAMREVLRGGLSIALSGVIFWSHDIGGTDFVMPDPELYIRWAQFGMFTSHTRCHSNHPDEPWNFGKRAENIFRKYDKLRYSLIPYIYSCAYECIDKNISFIKPLVLEYQDDPIAQNIDDEYIFGNSFLVAPIFWRRDYRYIYLPQGKWIDFWTKKIYEGERSFKYKASLNILPLFVKSGSIIPMQDDVSYIEDKPLDKIIVDIYPDRKSKFKYRDDYEKIYFGCISNNKTIEINISNINKNYKLILNNHKDRVIKINGITISKDVININERDDQAIIHLKKPIK